MISGITISLALILKDINRCRTKRFQELQALWDTLRGRVVLGRGFICVMDILLTVYLSLAIFFTCV